MGIDSTLDPDPKSHYFWSWKDLIIIIAGIAAIFVVVVIVLFAAFYLLNISIDEINQPTFIQSIGLVALEALALIGGVYIFGIHRKGFSWGAVGLRNTTWNWVIATSLITIVIIPIVSLITLVLILLLGQSFENPQLEFLLPEQLSPASAILMIILSGVVAPFGEELLFRGVFYSLLRGKWSVIPSVLLSSFLFGLFHGNLVSGFTGFLLGIVAALVYEYSQSLWTSVIVHSINNSTRIALLYILVLLGYTMNI